MATKLLEAVGKWFLEPSSNEETRGLEDIFLTPSWNCKSMRKPCEGPTSMQESCAGHALFVDRMSITCQLHVK
ncbi:hypothetical protein AGABI1DRAFT_116594, partial [Agaricus bisporus var. burnettii JB137-S8]